MTNAEGFPWGLNQPTRRQRVVVAFCVALFATAVLYASYLDNPGRKTDFSNVWFGALMMLHGRDPYPLLGPGLSFDMPFPLLYPASSFVIVLPFALVPEQAAALLFVAISVFLMVYGITAGSWHRLPILASAAFGDSILAAQWTILMTAALFLPWVSVFTPAKPQSGLPIIAASKSRVAVVVAALSALALVAVSLFMLPGWPREWFSIVSNAPYERPPIVNPLGWPVLLLLLRWRRSESWLVLATACLPQTFMWYSALALLTVGATYRQACAISLISTLGFLLGNWLIYVGAPHLPIATWTVYVGSTILPCVVLILRRPNEGPLPAWLGFLRPERAGLSS